MITTPLIESFSQVLIPTILAVLFLKDRTKENYIKIAFFVIVFVLYGLLSQIHPHFINSNWNWDGKICNIIFVIIAYFIFRKYFAKNDFFTLKQNKETNKSTWITIVILIVYVSILALFLFPAQVFDKETLAFQLLMPHADEEPLFRGILFGLLLSALPQKIRLIGNPSVFIIAFLFGMVHSLSIAGEYFDPGIFLHTGIIGWVLCWLALKSRSLLKPIIAHLGVNQALTIITMIK
ncbi:MAG: CPBP family intramembrane metalloprotease [Crocinitomicaceae bacterium]|nr:CPBP family intramembrane metalloprotease [Crocinitomicaceae bacterium]